MRRAGLLRLWLRLLVSLYPPGFREPYGEGLLTALLGQAEVARRAGRASLAAYVTWNSVLCLRDAAIEWAGAARAAWLRRGGEGTMGETIREWARSVRLAARGLMRHPGYAVPVLATVALGIGANTAMFTVLDAVVLRDLPYPDADRLVEVHPLNLDSRNEAAFSLPDARDWAERSSTLAAMGAWSMLPSDMVYTGGGEAMEVETTYVTAGFFDAMAVRPALGTLPTEAQERGDNRVVVLSHAFWRDRLGSDPARVGQAIPLNGEPYTVVGVMPPSFAFPDARVEVWAFLTTIPQTSIPLQIRAVRFLEAVARLEPGTTPAQASDELGALASALANDFPDSNGRLRGAVVLPLRRAIVGRVDGALAVLMAASLLILAIACSNLANLALAREARRTPELAVRAALGASGARRASLVLTESVVLSLLGGALGLVLAVWGTDALLSGAEGVLPRANEIGPDWRVATFALVASVATAVSFALLPGLRAGRRDLASLIRSTGRGSAAGGIRKALVVSQVSLSVVLTAGALLLVESLDRLGRVDPGFEPEGLIVADMTFAASRFPERPDYLARFAATLEALEALPGVGSVSTVRRFPFRGQGEGVRWRLPEDGPDAEGTSAYLLQVETGFFATMRVPFSEGGPFPPEARDGLPMVVVNRALADAAFGGAPARGRTIDVQGYPLEVVGVVENVRHGSLTDAPPGVLYIHQSFSPRRGAAFLVRTTPGASGMIEAVRGAIRRGDPRQPITELTWATAIVDSELARPSFYATLLGLFALLALVLSAVGVYGVVEFGVAQRRREVGVRLAMGADGPRVRSMLVRQGMVPVAAGLALGVALTGWAVGALDALLYDVSRFDPVAYALAGGVMLLIGFAGCWIPAGSALRIRPVDALSAGD